MVSGDDNVALFAQNDDDVAPKVLPTSANGIVVGLAVQDGVLDLLQRNAVFQAPIQAMITHSNGRCVWDFNVRDHSEKGGWLGLQVNEETKRFASYDS